MRSKMVVVGLFLACTSGMLLCPGSAAPQEHRIAILSAPTAAPCVEYAIDRLVAALEHAGCETERVGSRDELRGRTGIAIGTMAPGASARAQLQNLGIALGDSPESLAVARIDRGDSDLLVIAGADDRGTMYAALDAADRIRHAKNAADPFGEIEDISESPRIAERAVSIYTMHRAYWESRFYDEDYWNRYFDLLARSRINAFVIIFGYENGGFLAPPYPYFFDLDEFSGVRMLDITPEQQTRNIEAINRIIEVAHHHAIDVTLGIWDHIYRGAVQAGGIEWADQYKDRPLPSTVQGLDADNLRPYTIAALGRFLELVPAVDGIQFRMHWESGIQEDEMDAFWGDVFRTMKDHNPDMRFDARAKGLPDSVIETGLDMGIPLRICTKYWMEQMGLPFHPMHVNPQNQHDRRHGYADLLRYPRRYDMHWRLWNGGTARVFLWGDPEYVRRFTDSTFLYDSPTFEVNEMLCTKMEAQPHDRAPFDLLGAPYRYYDYEFERYWHFYQVWGRVGYNPNTSPEVWRMAFEEAVGEAAAPYAEAGLHRASQILPRIVASCYPYSHFPMTRGWAEKQCLGDLPAYAKNQGTDVALFLNFEDEARLRCAGGESPLVRPDENSRWLLNTAAFVLEQAEGMAAHGGSDGNLECQATEVDLRMLAHLAQYHGYRSRAAVAYNCYKHAGELNALDEAVRWEARAVQAWRRMVEIAGDRFAEDLMFGARNRGLCGHWRDELKTLEASLAALRREAAEAEPGKPLAHIPVNRAVAGKPLVVRATLQDGVDPVLHYHVGTGEGKDAPMEKIGPYRYQAEIPAAAVQRGLTYRLMDGTPVDVLVASRPDRNPPRVEHTPVATADAGQPLVVSAHVQDRAGVRWARVRYRNVTQFEDYQTLEMQPTVEGKYQATIPGEAITPEWDFMYYLEVMDNHGNGAIYPDIEETAPYHIVQVNR